MGAAASRLLATLYLAASAPSAAAAAPSAAPLPPPLPPPCAGHVAVTFTNAATTGDTHGMTVVLTSTANACTLRGFPELVLPSAQAAPLPVGHVTRANPVVLAAGSPAVFAIRYVTSRVPAPEPCSLTVNVNSVPGSTQGTLPFAACASVTQIDVTSYARQGQGPFEAQLVASNDIGPPCAAHDLELREVRTAPPGELARDAIYAVQNRAAACTLTGVAGIRLIGPDGNVFPLHFAVRNTMAMVLTLASEHEASFTVSYVPPAPARCPMSTRIEVFVPTQTVPLDAPASVMACAWPAIRVGNLRSGVPLPHGITSG